MASKSRKPPQARVPDAKRIAFPQPKPTPLAPDPRIDPKPLAHLRSDPGGDVRVRRQASEWLSEGLIGKSVIDGKKGGSYNRVHEFSLQSMAGDEDFRYWHVEDLLEQMSTLFERALQTRVTWQDKLSKSFYLECEVKQHLEGEKIYANEVKAGLYEVPVFEAKQQNESNRLNWQATQIVASQKAGLLSNLYDSTSRLAQVNAEVKAAWVSAFSTFVPGNTGEKSVFTYGTDAQTRPDHLYNAAATRSQWQLGVATSGINSEVSATAGLRDVSAAAYLSTQRRNDWETKNAQFKMARANLARLIAEQKLAAFTTPGGALNFPEQMRGAADRMGRDTSDGLGRIRAAAAGLKQIYGYASALPPTVPPAMRSRAGSTQLLDDCANWVRDAIAWLTRFKQLDQNLVLPVSLRSIMGSESAWKAGRDAGEWVFPFPATDLDSLHHVRIRGVRAYAYGPGPEAGFWRVDLIPPQQATCRHLDGTRVPLDQTSLPRVSLPRVGSRQIPQELEWVGASALYNASPIGVAGPDGNWTVRISTQSSQRQPASKITDVELELAIAARYVKS